VTKGKRAVNNAAVAATYVKRQEFGLTQLPLRVEEEV